MTKENDDEPPAPAPPAVWGGIALFLALFVAFIGAVIIVVNALCTAAMDLN